MPTLRKAFDSVWFNRIVGLFGIVGVPISLVLYYLSVREPLVTYVVDPERTIVARSGVTSDLSILYKDSPVTHSVTSVWLEIWNDGRAPVERKAILEPLEIHLPAGNRVLVAKVLKSSRHTVGFAIGPLQGSQDTVPLDFRILEHRDAALVQLIYEGDPDAEVTVTGVIVGQPAIERLDLRRLQLNYRPPPLSRREATQLIYILFAVSGLLCALGVFFGWKDHNLGSADYRTKRSGFMLGALVCFLTALILAWQLWFTPPPILG